MNKPMLVIGVALLGLAVTISLLLPTLFTQIPYQLVNSAAFAGIFVFISGWLAVGVSLGVGRSWRRSMLVALIFYIVIGMLWSVVFYVGFNTQRLYDLVNDPRRLFAAIALFWMWPLQVGQVLGLFYFGG